MHKLEDLIIQILERGADSASFSKIAPEVSALEPADALVVWLKALSKNPDLILARLQLAKLLWQLDCVPFALEQLQQIETKVGSAQSESLKNLIVRLGGSSQGNGDTQQNENQDDDPSGHARIIFRRVNEHGW